MSSCFPQGLRTYLPHLHTSPHTSPHFSRLLTTHPPKTPTPTPHLTPHLTPPLAPSSTSLHTSPHTMQAFGHGFPSCQPLPMPQPRSLHLCKHALTSHLHLTHPLTLSSHLPTLSPHPAGLLPRLPQLPAAAGCHEAQRSALAHQGRQPQVPHRALSPLDMHSDDYSPFSLQPTDFRW